MSRLLRFLIIGALLVSAGPSAIADVFEQQSEPVTLQTSDGVTIYGDWFEAADARATILLFHQGGSNARAEYPAIIPRLLANNFSVLTIDQRRGGQTYGKYNRTVAEDSRRWSYCEVTPDLEAAVDYAKSKRPGDPMILWGSSYSAALALRLGASRQDEFAGVLAFSPASGGPMAECSGDVAFPELEIPAMVLRPASEAENESVVAQLEAAGEHGLTVYVADPGVHGSSMLVEDRVQADTSETWSQVETFLDSLVQ